MRRKKAELGWVFVWRTSLRFQRNFYRSAHPMWSLFFQLRKHHESFDAYRSRWTGLEKERSAALKWVFDDDKSLEMLFCAFAFIKSPRLDSLIDINPQSILIVNEKIVSFVAGWRNASPPAGERQTHFRAINIEPLIFRRLHRRVWTDDDVLVFALRIPPTPIKCLFTAFFPFRQTTSGKCLWLYLWVFNNV